MKKLHLKNFAILILAIFAIVAFALSYSVNSVKANDTDEYLTMNDGAYVRLTKEETGNGLRFVMGMTAGDYETLMENVGSGKTYKDVSFGMLIAPADYLTHYDLTVENVFGENAKYDWANDNGVYSGKNGVDGSKVRIINKATSDLYPNAVFGDGYYYACSIVDIADANITREFVGKGYVKYVDGDDNITYKTASFSGDDIANNTRTMLSIALAAIESGEYDEDEITALTNLYVNKATFTVMATGCTASVASAVYGTTVTLSGTPETDCTLKYIVNGERIEGNSFTLTENTTVTAINVYNTALTLSQSATPGNIANGVYADENIGLKAKGSLINWAYLTGNGTVLFNGEEIEERIQVTESAVGAKTIYMTNTADSLGARPGDSYVVKAGYDIVIDGIHYITAQDYNFFSVGANSSGDNLSWRTYNEEIPITLSLGDGGNGNQIVFNVASYFPTDTNAEGSFVGWAGEEDYVCIKGVYKYQTKATYANTAQLNYAGKYFYFNSIGASAGDTVYIKKGFAILHKGDRNVYRTTEDYTFTYSGTSTEGWFYEERDLTLTVAGNPSGGQQNNYYRLFLTTNVPFTGAVEGTNTAYHKAKVTVKGTPLNEINNDNLKLWTAHAYEYEMCIVDATTKNLGGGFSANGGAAEDAIVIKAGFRIVYKGIAYVLREDKHIDYMGNNCWSETLNFHLHEENKGVKKQLYLLNSPAFSGTAWETITTENIGTKVLVDGETKAGITLGFAARGCLYFDNINAAEGTVVTILKGFRFDRNRVSYVTDKDYMFLYSGGQWNVVELEDRTEGIRLGVFSSPKNTQSAYNTCADAGFNYVLIDQNYADIGTADYKQILVYCDNAGMYAIPMTLGTNDKTFYADVAGYEGKFFYDEPSSSSFATIASYISAFEALNPNGLFLNNLLPRYSAQFASDSEYEAYLAAYVSTVLNNLTGEKILMVDYYPLINSGVQNTYLYNLEKTAQLTKNTDIEVNYFVQATGIGNNLRDVTSAADILFQYYTGLAYGVKGFWAFTYSAQSGEDFAGHTQMLDADGNPTAVYNYVKSANENVAYISDIFVGYDYVGTKAVLGTGHVSNSCFNKLSNNLASVTGISTITASQDTLIGEFVKDSKAGYMVTNFSEPSAAATDTVTLTFASSVTVDIYQNGTTTEWTGTSLELTLAAGEGAFVTVK